MKVFGVWAMVVDRAGGTSPAVNLSPEAAKGDPATYAFGGLYGQVHAKGSKVGIGTANPQERLSVNGRVMAKEVVVTHSGWADYVFADDYDLMPLTEVDAFIRSNRHLPGVPTEAAVAEHGVEIGQSQAMLLAKIEELTLYAIEQHNRADAAERELQVLAERLRAVEAALQTRK